MLATMLLVLFIALVSFMTVPAQARVHHRRARAEVLHRITTGDSKIRINNVGEVITDRKP